MSMERDLEFIYEIGTLRFVPRQWTRFLNADFSNVAEHHFRVMWLALLIAKHEKVGNTEKIIKMALVHDISESRTGDVDYLSRQYVERKEELGIEDMLHSTSLEKEFLDLWHEYEKRESIESKIVKDADNLEVDLELREQAVNGVALEQEWMKQRTVVKTDKLYTKTAKKMWIQIKKSNPHDWHLKGRNRINAGDWKR